MNLWERFVKKCCIWLTGTCCKDCRWFVFNGDHPAAGFCHHWQHQGPRDGYAGACTDLREKKGTSSCDGEHSD